jgi:hypothetical protein
MMRWIPMAAAVLAVLALWAAFRGPSAPAPVGAPTPAATPERAEPRPEPAPASGRRAAPLPTLLVVDEAERAVAAAAIWRYAERDDGTATTDGEPLAEAESEGRIAWTGLGDHDQRVLVRAEGYVPAVVKCGPGPEHVVHLRASPRVTVQVIRDVGAPLAEVRVVLSAQVLSTVVGLPGSGVGAPLHPRPVWSGVTDQSGVGRSRARGLVWRGHLLGDGVSSAPDRIVDRAPRVVWTRSTPASRAPASGPGGWGSGVCHRPLRSRRRRSALRHSLTA